MPRQLCCRVMCKILLLSLHSNFAIIFQWIWMAAEKLKSAPGLCFILTFSLYKWPFRHSGAIQNGDPTMGSWCSVSLKNTTSTMIQTQQHYEIKNRAINNIWYPNLLIPFLVYICEGRKVYQCWISTLSPCKAEIFLGLLSQICVIDLNNSLSHAQCQAKTRNNAGLSSIWSLTIISGEKFEFSQIISLPSLTTIWQELHTWEQ